MKNIVLIIALAMPLAGCFDYSDGARTGTVIKFSRKGIFCKTWEGEMLLGGMKKKTNTNSNGDTSTSMVANTWSFTVEDMMLIPKIQAAMEAGQPVTVEYRQELMTFCRSDSDGDYFATGIH